MKHEFIEYISETKTNSMSFPKIVLVTKRSDQLVSKGTMQKMYLCTPTLCLPASLLAIKKFVNTNQITLLSCIGFNRTTK